jgi:hypothetical protein
MWPSHGVIHVRLGISAVHVAGLCEVQRSH